jgi:hypothetical protein
MQDTELRTMATLCYEVTITISLSTFHILKNHDVLVSGQSIINNYLNSF